MIDLNVSADVDNPVRRLHRSQLSQQRPHFPGAARANAVAAKPDRTIWIGLWIPTRSLPSCPRRARRCLVQPRILWCSLHRSQILPRSPSVVPPLRAASDTRQPAPDRSRVSRALRLGAMSRAASLLCFPTRPRAARELDITQPLPICFGNRTRCAHARARSTRRVGVTSAISCSALTRGRRPGPYVPSPRRVDTRASLCDRHGRRPGTLAFDSP